MTQTSTGFAYLLFDCAEGDDGLMLCVDSYDKSGWVTNVGRWRSDGEDDPLAEFLQRALSIPQPEAEALAATVQTKWVPEWEASGGRQRSRRLSRQAAWLLASVAVLVVLAVLSLVLLLILIVG